MHGVSREWNAKGRLLGSFTMYQGTGTTRHWHENGRLRMEANLVDGKLHGRTRAWLRDGTLVQENFYIGNLDATRAAYLKAARQNPDWPQYNGQTAGRVARGDRALKLKEHELFMESLLEKKHAEARQWLSETEQPDLRSLARFRTAKAALYFVESLYAAGAETVIAALIYTGRRGKQFADRLLVKLPKASAKRKALRKICQDLCDKRGGAMLPDEQDMGESHLFLNLE
ncbi:MAG: toxin-antitoxin system YwqK family antitoxin [Limisphaerales bacterium]